MIVVRIYSAAALALAVSPCLAQPGVAAEHEPAGAAATIDVFASNDADDTEVFRTGFNLDWLHQGQDRYQGVRVERAWFRPLGQQATTFERIYLRLADKNNNWSWNGQIGTDGDTVLGSFNIANASPYRTEFFVERDILETPQGVSEGIYYTFGGAALDIPLGDRDAVALVVGAQEFTGKNVRLHARGNYIHVVKPDWGLSAQLRGRYFYSTEPGEFDYFSPRWYAEILPVLQIRRYSGGWRYLVAAGYGMQSDAGSSWRSSRYLNAQVSTPASRPVSLTASLVYSNTPVGSGAVYDYVQGSLSITSRF